MTRLLFSAVLLFACATHAAAAARSAKLRALCFEQVDGIADVLFVGPDGKSTVPLTLWTTSFSDEIDVTIDNETIRFAVLDKTPDGKEALRTVAQGKAVEGARQLAVFLPQKGEIPYRLVMLDDSEKSFPMGSVAALNLAATQVRLQIGEHDLKLQPGGRETVGQPKKVNDRNQVNVEISFLGNTGAWVPVNNTRWLVTPLARTLVIAFIHPKTGQPTVNSYSDTPPWRAPKMP